MFQSIAFFGHYYVEIEKETSLFDRLVASSRDVCRMQSQCMPGRFFTPRAPGKHDAQYKTIF